MPESNSFLTDEKNPKLPIYSKTLEFNPNTKIIKINVIPNDLKEFKINKQVQPVPIKQEMNEISLSSNVEVNEDVYLKNTPYPELWYNYKLGAGLNKKNNHVTFLNINLCPVRYNPGENIIQYVGNFEVQIKYVEPQYNPVFTDDFNLVIISPSEFETYLGPLVTHKNNMGVSTNLVLLEDIYNTYPGRDDAEKIKYFIKYAIDEWNTQYVLLVGDIYKLPIRKTYASWWEPNLLSDLYYADIYDNQFEFCSWDSNENNRFGEINGDGYDIDGVDLYPDVHVGRLACKNIDELDIVINKIITYETQTYGQDWFDKIILAGGDTFPPRRFGTPFVYEGEITNQAVADVLPEFEHIKLWASKRNLNAITFNRKITKGAGFVSYAGHGFEHGWGTYRPNQLTKNMIFYFMPYVNYLKNQNMLPIIFFDACLTAKLDFNITDLKHYFPILTQFWLLSNKIVDDPSVFYTVFAWSFLAKEGGGAIATIGSTRTAYTRVDSSGVYGGAGYMDVGFFEAYEEGITVGQMLTYSQNKYINNVGKDYFTLEEFILLGDPSLKVGGYAI